MKRVVSKGLAASEHNVLTAANKQYHNDGKNEPGFTQAGGLLNPEDIQARVVTFVGSTETMG